MRLKSYAQIISESDVTLGWNGKALEEADVLHALRIPVC